MILCYSLKYLGLVIYIFANRLFQGLKTKDSKVNLTFRLFYSLQFETEVHLVNDQVSILEYYCTTVHRKVGSSSPVYCSILNSWPKVPFIDSLKILQCATNRNSLLLATLQ